MTSIGKTPPALTPTTSRHGQESRPDATGPGPLDAHRPASPNASMRADAPVPESLEQPERFARGSYLGIRRERTLEGLPTPADTESVRKREQYYADMDFDALVVTLTRMMNENIFGSLSRAVQSRFRGVAFTDEGLIAFREYVRRDGDPEYFTSGAGARGNCTVM